VALRRAALALVLLASGAARAADDAGASPDAAVPDTGLEAPPPDAGAPRDAAVPDAAAAFEPPRALSDTHVPYPPGAPEIAEPVVVTVKLRVDTTGHVVKAELRTPPQPPFDDAVLAAARAFTFEPGRYKGAPVTVEVTFTQRFLPRTRPTVEAAPGAAPSGPALTSVLRGRLVELGTRAALAHATVSALVDKQYYTAESGTDGRFRLPLPPGAARVSVYAADHNTFVQNEALKPNQELAVTYLVERERYNRYETVVVAERRREEVSRTTLRGAEIHQIPGTFGDPFRVIQTLPGVASVISLLPFPVIRGSSPASSGFLIDGVRVPLLFHLLAGPSVIHPEFIDEIRFIPGGAPAPYGGYVGGIVDGRTARAQPDAHLIDLDFDLREVGGLVREPVAPLGATVTAAARYGFPGLLLKLATNQISLSYWDYQLRLDGGNAQNGWTLFVYGAYDEIDTPAASAAPNDPNPPLAPLLELGFHRVDARVHRASGRLEGTARLILGYDRTYSNGTDFWVWSAEPRFSAQWTQSERLRVAAGLEGSARDVQEGSASMSGANAFSALFGSLGTVKSESAYLEAIIRPTPRSLVRPGVRTDAYEDNTATKGAIDPRLTVRYRLLDRDLPGLTPGSDDAGVWLKASAGIYHQPPRFVLPLPGLDIMPLKYGLLRTYQTTLGAEIPLEEKVELSVEGYYNDMNPTIFDFTVNSASAVTTPNQTLTPNTIVSPPMDGADFINRLTNPQLGRAYGLELMLRRKSTTGLYGWIAYTLERSERFHPAAGTLPAFWAPYDFDRTHLFNLVAGMPLRRNWDVGIRLQYQSGRPTTVTSGYNGAYGTGYFRFDFRIDKHAVWRKWLLDFYVDVTNATVSPEEIEPGTVFRYVFPTAGVRARL